VEKVVEIDRHGMIQVERKDRNIEVVLKGIAIS
jgi:hypothetical protein